MKYILLLLFVSNQLFACPLGTIEEKYQNYKQGLTIDNLSESAALFFTSSLLGENYTNDPDAQEQLLFHQFIAEEISYVENIGTANACLSINGFAQDSSPVTIVLNYKYQNENWLINQIHLKFLENQEQFAKQCHI